jgi:RNA polymerase sigma-70 factor (ECF subfamily)
VCQEVLRKVLEQLPRFDPEGPGQLTTWAFVIAHRMVLDLRKRRHLSLASLEEAVEVPDLRVSLEAGVERGELRTAIEAAIGRLPEAQRRIFVLAEVHDQPLEAIAEVEGVPVGTVKSRIARGRTQLAETLGNRDTLAGRPTNEPPLNPPPNA